MQANDPLLGTVLDGRFELRERLGSGAMGVVYRACQLSIGREVAVKVLSSLDAEALQRFVREAKIASTLAHPNTVQIIEFGKLADGGAYIAMELVPGGTLLEVIENGPLPTRRLVGIGTQLCDALEAAHRLDIVHRDLKPENIMIARDGSDRVKVLDFGIARMLGDASLKVTTTGMAAGTPHYMAPEVLVHAVDPSPPQDMYALGVILAELSLGETLFAGVTSLQMLLTEKLRNSAVARVTPRLRPLVKKLMDHDPAQRPSPTEARTALRELERTATDPAGIAQTIQPMPGLASLEIVGLDEHRDVASRTTPHGALPSSVFSPATPPPTETAPGAATSSADLALEVDGTWAAEREARKDGRAAASSSPQAQRFLREQAAHARGRRGGNALTVAFALIVAGVAGGAYYMTTRDSASAPPVSKPGGRTRTIDELGGVSIRFVGPAGTPITIDGVSVGKVPLSLKRKPSKRLLLIEAPGIVKQIVPDHNQTVDLTR